MRILIKELRFETIIGILDAERVTPQPVVLHVTIDYAYQTGSFIDYAEIATFLEQTMQRERYALIEEALEDLLQKLLEKYPPIEKVKLTLLKPTILANAVVGLTQKIKRNKN